MSHRSPPPPPISHAISAILLLLLAVACAAPVGPVPVAPERLPTLRPGDPRIRTARALGAECFEYRAFGVDDTVGRRLGLLSLEWGGRNSRNGSKWLRTAYARQSEDTIEYDPRSLAPSRERLRIGDQDITLRYRGARVEREVRRGDSVESRREIAFDRPVFGFNQRELLLRVVRLQPRDTLILPLYSEVDAALELDTISLVSAAPGRGVVIRFADPAIVALVTVDTLARRILGEEIRNRRRDGHLTRTLLTTGGECTG